MVPVSDTTHDLNLAAAAGALLEAAAGGLVLVVLEPHAAASRATTLSTATLPSFPLTGYLLCQGRPPGRTAGSLAQPRPTGARKSRAPLDFPKASPDPAVREA